MPLKILLADDSMTAQSMGKRILTDAGYDVVTVSNGAAAVRKFPEIMPDVAVLDVYMPGYNGLEVCERIKASPRTAHIPVLLTVGKLEPFSPEEGMRVKAEGVIIKPFEASDLIAVISKVAERVHVSVPAPVAPVPQDEPVEFMDPEPVEAFAPPERPLEIPNAAAGLPAMGEDFLEAEPDLPVSSGSDTLEPEYAGAPAHLEEFSIELEPLPMGAPENSASLAEPWGQPQPTTGQPTPSFANEIAVLESSASPEIPIEFEIDERAEDPQNSSVELVDLAPFMAQLGDPDQAAQPNELSELSSGQASWPAEEDRSECGNAEPSEAASAMVIQLDELMGDAEPAAVAAPVPAAHDSAAEELDRTLHAALAITHDEGRNPVSEVQRGTENYDLDASAVEEHPADAGLPVSVAENPIGDMPGGSDAEAPANFIDLDSLLAEPPQAAETEAAVSATPQSGEPVQEPSAVAAIIPEGSTNTVEASAEPLGAVQSQSHDFDVNQAIAEQIAERVFQRLKPALIEEIRNVLKDM